MQAHRFLPYLDDRLATPSTEDLGDLLDLVLEAFVDD
jgi:hypothetical protein